MPLLLGDDEVEALEAALSYVDALPMTNGSALPTQGNSVTTATADSNGALGVAAEGEVRLGAELDRLLLETLSSSSEHDSDTTAQLTTSTTLTMEAVARHVLPEPLPPMVANVGTPDVSGQGRRSTRATKNTTTTLAKTKRRVKGNDKHRGVVYENATKNLETFSDTIMEAFTMEFLGKTTTADFRQALDPTNSPFSSFGFVDKGYVVTRRPTSIPPGHGDFTVLQMCSLVSPQMATGCRIDMTAAGDFTEFVLNVTAANTTFSNELIENVLLDQALNRHQGETSLAA
ncbi:hypothetical protein PRNP1_013134 [Phytophthora ramorum]